MQKKNHKPFPQVIVRLPRVKAAAAVTLGNGLRHAAETLDDLPIPLTQAITLMVVTHQALVEVWVARLAAKKKDRKMQTIMRNERIAIRNLYGYLLRLAQMDSEITQEISAQAQTVIDIVFPQGMAFTTGNHAEVYAEMDRRFDAIDTGNLRNKITSLGGHILLHVIETNHHKYLEELGGGGVKKEKYEENLRELMEAFLARVRMLVVHTHAWLDVCPERADDALMLLQTIETIGKMKDNVSLDGGPSLAQALTQTVNATRALTAKVNEAAVETTPTPAMVMPESSTEAEPKTSSPGTEAEPKMSFLPLTETPSDPPEAPPAPMTETEPNETAPPMEDSVETKSDPQETDVQPPPPKTDSSSDDLPILQKMNKGEETSSPPNHEPDEQEPPSEEAHETTKDHVTLEDSTPT